MKGEVIPQVHRKMRKKEASSRYRLFLEELTIKDTTLNIKEDKAQLSLRDKMFQGLGS